MHRNDSLVDLSPTHTPSSHRNVYKINRKKHVALHSLIIIIIITTGDNVYGAVI